MLVTTCPDCATTFKLTVALLEKAGGQVRCGRCANVFDANLSLREQDESPTIRIEPGAASVEDSGEVAVEMGTGSRWIFRERPPDAPAPDASGPDDSIAAGDAPSQDDDGPDEPKDEVAAAVSAGNVGAGDDDTDAPPDRAADGLSPADVPSAAAGGGPSAGAAAPGAAPDFGADPDWLPPAAEARPARRALWAAAGVVLMLLLAGQLVHASRHELATLPRLGPALVATYAGLGIELAPRIDLAQYDTVDLTAVAEPVSAERGWLIIETRVQNKGPKLQPYPHIFVGLLDRWQETIAGRYFGPEEYTVPPASDYSRMDVGRTIDAQFVIVDPGPSATGFVLEFCAPTADGFVCESE